MFTSLPEKSKEHQNNSLNLFKGKGFAESLSSNLKFLFLGHLYPSQARGVIADHGGVGERGGTGAAGAEETDVQNMLQICDHGGWGGVYTIDIRPQTVYEHVTQGSAVVTSLCHTEWHCDSVTQ